MIGPRGTVLHISSDFAQQDVYPKLVRHLREAGERQTVFVPVRTVAEASRQPPDEPGWIAYRFRHVLRPVHRLLFRTKVRVVLRALRAEVDLTGVDVVHAHFLYSDGAVALRLKGTLGLPYLVAVRNTDVNYFMRLRPDLGWLAAAVLEGAERVVFVSPAYREALLARLGARLRAAVAAKAIVVPNGLGREWLDAVPPAAAGGETLRLLYVGDATPNKNILSTMRAAAVLVRRRPVSLTLVGGGGDAKGEVARALASGAYPFVQQLGRIDDAVRLREVFRSHDLFVMPSFLETFGVVYLEALSQGLPVIHSRGQGVDGLFAPDTVSRGVDPADPADIAAGIEELAERRNAVRDLCIREAKRFGWDVVAARYVELYGQVRRRVIA